MDAVLFQKAEVIMLVGQGGKGANSHVRVRV